MAAEQLPKTTYSLLPSSPSAENVAAVNLPADSFTLPEELQRDIAAIKAKHGISDTPKKTFTLDELNKEFCTISSIEIANATEADQRLIEKYKLAIIETIRSQTPLNDFISHLPKEEKEIVPTWRRALRWLGYIVLASAMLVILIMMSYDATLSLVQLAFSSFVADKIIMGLTIAITACYAILFFFLGESEEIRKKFGIPKIVDNSHYEIVREQIHDVKRLNEAFFSINFANTVDNKRYESLAKIIHSFNDDIIKKQKSWKYEVSPIRRFFEILLHIFAGIMMVGISYFMVHAFLSAVAPSIMETAAEWAIIAVTLATSLVVYIITAARNVFDLLNPTVYKFEHVAKKLENFEPIQEKPAPQRQEVPDTKALIKNFNTLCEQQPDEQNLDVEQQKLRIIEQIKSHPLFKDYIYPEPKEQKKPLSYEKPRKIGLWILLPLKMALELTAVYNVIFSLMLLIFSTFIPAQTLIFTAQIVSGIMAFIYALLFGGGEYHALRKGLGIPSSALYPDIYEVINDQIHDVHKINAAFLNKNFAEKLSSDDYVSLQQLILLFNQDLDHKKQNFHYQISPFKKYIGAITQVIASILFVGISFYLTHGFLSEVWPSSLETLSEWIIISLTMLASLSFYLILHRHTLFSTINPMYTEFQTTQHKLANFEVQDEDKLRNAVAIKKQQEQQRQEVEVVSDVPAVAGDAPTPAELRRSSERQEPGGRSESQAQAATEHTGIDPRSLTHIGFKYSPAPQPEHSTTELTQPSTTPPIPPTDSSSCRVG